MRLQQRQARETGICPVREDLYGQAFGELPVLRSPRRTHTCSPLSLPLSLPNPFSIALPPTSPADELIREVTVNCAERGALLLRVRDEIRMTLTAYQSLYESSVAFGMRKALMADQRKNELRAKVKLLTAEVRELEKAADGLQSRSGDLEASEKQRYAQDEEKHAAEVGKLKTANDDLREQLEGLLAVKR
jgi:dynein light intermediate chain